MQPEFPRSGALAHVMGAALEAVLNGVLITDAQHQDNPIIYCNPGFVRLTGYQPHETLGRNARFLQGSETDPRTVAKVHAAIAAARPFQCVIKNYRKDGTSFWNEMSIAPIYDAAGHLTHFVGVQTDVTAHIEAEAALHASEERFAKAFYASPIAITISTLDTGRFLAVNDQFVQLSGYQRDEAIGRTALDLGLWANPADRSRIIHLLHVHGTVRYHETQFRTKSGELRHAIVSIEPIEVDREAALLMLVEDVTERKRAEAAMRASETRLQTVIDHLPVVLFMTDRHGVVTLSEGKGLAALGLRSSQVVGQSGFTLYAHVPDALEAFRRALEGNETSWSGWVGERVVDVIITPIREADDQISGVLGLVLDVTERKQAEAALRASEIRLQTVIANLPVILFVLDPDGMITLSDGKGLARLGLVPGQLAGLSVFDLYGHLPGGMEAFRSALQGNEEYWSGWVEGRMFEIYLTPIRAVEGQLSGVLGLALDVTERQQAEEERQAIERKMLESQHLESLGVLAGGIAHDFNNLLMIILGNSSLALLDLALESPARPSVVQIEHAAQRAADLTRQLLAYTGKGRIAVQSINLNLLIGEMTHLLEMAIPKHVSVRTSLAAELPPIEADVTQTRQLVMNLVLNGAEAIETEAGEVTLTTEARWIDRDTFATVYQTTDMSEGQYVVLTVTDTGRGMDDATRTKIFDPFFTTKFTGRGLGLAAVQGIVRGHRGMIHVASAPGRGSTFTLVLPRSVEPEKEASHQGRNTEAWQGQGTILVVDDEADVRTVTTRMLERFGFTVLTAADGQAGVDLFRAQAGTVAGVLLDVTMPRMSGPSAFHELRHIRPTVPIVLMSGHNEQGIVEQLAGHGLAGFLAKPFQPDDLRRVLEQALSGGNADQA